MKERERAREREREREGGRGVSIKLIILCVTNGKEEVCMYFNSCILQMLEAHWVCISFQ